MSRDGMPIEVRGIGAIDLAVLQYLPNSESVLSV
jgi:hypothetical protein